MSAISDDVCRCRACTRPQPLLHRRSVIGLSWYAAGLGLALVASHFEGGAGLGTVTGLLVAAYGYDICRRQARLERRAAGIRW